MSLAASTYGVAAAGRQEPRSSASASGRSVGDGVYSTAQATRGEKILNEVLGGEADRPEELADLLEIRMRWSRVVVFGAAVAVTLR